jgi:hypothetical protein
MNEPLASGRRRARALHSAVVLLDSDISPLHTFFLLSPAHCGSPRAARLIDGRSASALCQQLHSAEGAELGELFAFLSSLYFRGKLTYARAFARPPRALPGVLVIAPGEGLVAASERIGAARMRAFAEVDVHHANERFTIPLARDAQALAASAGDDACFVLLGSIASAKYLVPLQQAMGERLLFPSEFVGRGDMSRGGLLLRCAQDLRELDYQPVVGAKLHGPRVPRLPARTRRSGS